MLTPEEKRFVEYWSVQRDRRKTIASRLGSGLPLGVVIVGVLFAAVATGWYERATAVIRTHSSVILVVIVAAVGIVLFMSYFSAQHEWDQNEERYQHLLYRERQDAAEEPQ
jgi:predicted RND superfamily exporter protein